MLGTLAACSSMSGAPRQDPTSSPPAEGAGPTGLPSLVVAPSSSPARPIESLGSVLVGNADEALAAVIEEYPRFEGYPLLAEPSESLDPGDVLIGQSRWVIARPVSAGIELTFVTGSGDCPAGCIDHAYETYLVEPDGTVSFICSEDDSPIERAPQSTGRALGLDFEPCADLPR